MAANQAATSALTGMVSGIGSLAGAQLGAIGTQNAALINKFGENWKDFK